MDSKQYFALTKQLNTDMDNIQLENITIDVVKKNIRNIHLRVYSPTGRVRISAPSRMTPDSIRAFAVSKLDWIIKQQTKIKKQEREAPKEFHDGEAHPFNGRCYLLKVIEKDAAPRVELADSMIKLYVRQQTGKVKKKSMLDEWYRTQLKAALPSLIGKWEMRMGISVNEFRIKKMKTKWGTCNIRAKRIWLNLELAKKPAECLEYVVVHEMAHLLERYHNKRFFAYMDRFLPEWRCYKKELNCKPLLHDSRNY